MRKLATLLLSIVMVIGVAFGLAACSPEGPGGPTGGIEDGITTSAKAAKSYVAAREDTRPAAYAAYKANGDAVGTYKSLSNAVNAAVRGGGLTPTLPKSATKPRCLSTARATTRRAITTNASGFTITAFR